MMKKNQKCLRMRYFLFITAEGYTFQPGSESPDPDIENSQVIGFAEGRNIEAAFNNLIRDNKCLLETAFDEVKGYELASREGKYFHLKDIQKYSIL